MLKGVQGVCRVWCRLGVLFFGSGCGVGVSCGVVSCVGVGVVVWYGLVRSQNGSGGLEKSSGYTYKGMT